MANRNFLSKFTYSMSGMPVRLTTKASIGASGAPTIQQTNTGIKSITRLAAGVYRLQLDDNYAQFINIRVNVKSPVSGSNVAATALTPGTMYEITALGTTTQANWVTAGVPSGITAAVGTVFLAAATSSGNGTAKAIGVSGITSSEIMGNPQQMLSNQPFVQGQGGAYITFKTLAATDATTTTLLATDPADGSFLYIELIMNNSSIN